MLADHAEMIALLRKISSAPDLQTLSSRVLEQISSAYSTRDAQYPTSSSATVGGTSTLSDVSASDDFATSLGQLLSVGANRDSEILQIGMLALNGISKYWPVSSAALSKLSFELLWLECHSRFPILSYLALVLDEPKKLAIAKALMDGAHRDADRIDRGESCLASMWSQALAGNTQSLSLALAPSRCAPDASSSTVDDTDMPYVAPLLSSAQGSIRGRLSPAPRGMWSFAVSALSGWLLVKHLFLWTARLVLVYRANAEVRVTTSGIEIHEQRKLLGRLLHQRTSLIALPNVHRMSREVRFARAGTYAGLAALAIGSFIGVRLFIEGLRAPGLSGPTLLIGLMMVLTGLTLDFLLVHWLDSATKHCRFIIETARGRGICLSCDDQSHLDGVLMQVAKQLNA